MSDISFLYKPKAWCKLIVVFVERTLEYAAAFTLFTMMVITLVDVVGRNVFSAPLLGGFEVTELLLASLIFLGLPLVTARNEHVEVDLLDHFISTQFKSLQKILIKLINFIAFGIMSWMMWKYAIQIHSYQDTTAILEIPYSGLVFLMAICCSLSTIALLITPFLKRKK